MIKMRIEDQSWEVEKKYFPCGELLVQLPEPEFPDLAEDIELELVYESNDDLMLLLLVNNALRDIYHRDTWVSLTIGYFPYGRQDRVANAGEPLSLKVACQMINSCGFDSVTVIDPHSDVTPALIDNVVKVGMVDIMSNFWNSGAVLGDVDLIVSPDVGAYKKVGEVAKIVGMGVIRADKVRDTMTGQISDIEVYAEDLTGQSVAILDDICDGGGTFIGLAKKLKEKWANKVVLYTTHGMYTKGVDILLENGVDMVVCYNYYGDLSDKSKVVVLNQD